MPFKQAQVFAVARVSGATRIIDALTNPVSLEYVGTPPGTINWTAPPTWTLSKTPTGPTMSNLDLNDVFTIAQTGGGGQLGALTANLSALLALKTGTPAQKASYDFIVDAFSCNGFLSGAVALNVGGGTVPLLVLLRAFKSGQFNLVKRTAKAVFPAGASSPNFDPHPEKRQDYSAEFCNTSGAPLTPPLTSVYQGVKADLIELAPFSSFPSGTINVLLRLSQPLTKDSTGGTVPAYTVSSDLPGTLSCS